MANGIIPFSDMPSTYMLLEKMRGSSPRLLDSTTFEPESGANNHELVFSGQKPADSGVGASVGSCSNLPKENKNFAGRTFSDNFHDFVDQCCLKDAETRQSAFQLLSHPFIKQLKKTNSMTGFLSLSSLVSVENFISNQCSALDDEESLTMAMGSKMVIDEIEWNF